MSKEKMAASTVKMVPFAEIEVDETENARQEGVNQAKIKKLADSIAKEGLLEPIGVTNGTPNKYKVCYGYKRYAALKLLGHKGDVPVVVRQEGVVSNLIENIQRDDPTTADIAIRLQEMVKGRHPPQLGEPPAPKSSAELRTWEQARAFDKKDLANRLGFTVGYVSNLIRLAEMLELVPGALRAKIRKENLPARLLVELPSMKKKEKKKVEAEDGTETVEEVEVLHVDRIERRIDEWIATRKELSDTNLEADDAGPKKRKSKKKVLEASDINPTAMTIRVEVPEEVAPLEERLAAMKDMKKEVEKGGKVTERKAEKARLHPADYIRLLKVKLEEQKGQVERARFEGYIDAFRFMTRELDKLPGIAQKDWDVFLPKEEAAE